jgi:hypothetical protein
VITGANTYTWIATFYDNAYTAGCAVQATFNLQCFKGIAQPTEAYPLTLTTAQASTFSVVASTSRFTGGAINFGSPVPIQFTLDLGANNWLVGVVDGGLLKMSRIVITGANTYTWIATFYDNAYTAGCAFQATFNLQCFKGIAQPTEAYPLTLRTAQATTTTTTTAAVTCSCVTPNAGTSGNNQYRCTDGTSAWCTSTSVCFATTPFTKGDWANGCREASVTYGQLSGCCRFDSWTAANQGYLSKDACLDKCTQDNSCVCADIARSRSGSTTDFSSANTWDCYIFYARATNGVVNNYRDECGNGYRFLKVTTTTTTTVASCSCSVEWSNGYARPADTQGPTWTQTTMNSWVTSGFSGGISSLTLTGTGCQIQGRVGGATQAYVYIPGRYSCNTLPDGTASPQTCLPTGNDNLQGALMTCQACTPVLQIASTAYTPNTAAVGSVTGQPWTDGFAKLSDAAINAIAKDGTYNVFRLAHYGTCAGGNACTQNTIWYRTTSNFQDDQVAFGWQNVQACTSATKQECDTNNGWKGIGSLANSNSNLDTEGAFSNTCGRWFADYAGTINCYPSTSRTRCFTSGAPCNHAMRLNVVISKCPR